MQQHSKFTFRFVGTQAKYVLFWSLHIENDAPALDACAVVKLF